VKTVHDLCAGLPGLIVPYVHNLSYRLQTVTGDITVPFLRAIHELSNESMMNALKESRRVYKPYEVVPGAQNNENRKANKSATKNGRRK
jgi:hypothetical protein